MSISLVAIAKGYVRLKSCSGRETEIRMGRDYAVRETGRQWRSPKSFRGVVFRSGVWRHQAERMGQGIGKRGAGCLSRNEARLHWNVLNSSKSF
jgi:hypothetical protein